jgi:hypothetical protein
MESGNITARQNVLNYLGAVPRTAHSFFNKDWAHEKQIF